MPTFLVFKNGSVHNTIRGANPSALRSAVQAAAADAKGGAGANFNTGGSTLGGKGSTLGGRGSTTGRSVGGVPAMARGGAIDTVVRFFGLYFTTLFTLDPIGKAEQSPFRLQGAR